MAKAMRGPCQLSPPSAERNATRSVDLALGAAVVAAALRGVVIGPVGREHQQVVAAGRDRGAGLEQRPRRTVDHLSLYSGDREQSDIFQRQQTVGRGTGIDRRLMDGDPLCQRQRLVRHRDQPTLPPPPKPLKLRAPPRQTEETESSGSPVPHLRASSNWTLPCPCARLQIVQSYARRRTRSDWRPA